MTVFDSFLTLAVLTAFGLFIGTAIKSYTKDE